jgi:general secretion pathway protein K
LSARRNSAPCPARGERGIALILVLWVLALLALLAMGFAGSARTELQIARNQYGSAQARAIADAGVTFGILGVLDPSSQTQWSADGREYAVDYGPGTLRVSVQDEAGKINLNMAAPELLAGLLRTLGVDDAAGQQIVAAILERRRQAAAAADAARVAFRDVVELRLVPGLTRAVYQAMAPFVTVYTQSDRIDPLTAPAEVLRSLPGAVPQQVDAYLAARAQAGPQPTALPPLAGVDRFIARSAVQIVTIRAEGETATGAVFVREAAVAMTGNPPYRFLSWRQGERP